ncbi:MAG: adenylosuccinate lyase [Patescibacteria group bacterium]|nr:adenylosuccinate lyase [Patescibacteria group bacterium]
MVSFNQKGGFMIKRYNPKDVARIWRLRSKFEYWLKVELAMIKARYQRGDYPKNVYKQIRKKARFKVSEVQAIDKIIHHDLQAFVDNVRSYLDENLRKYFHEEMTSYDTEEPALALQLLKAGGIIHRELKSLADCLREKASQHMWTFCIGVTHGQDARPTTFGWRLCSYLEAIERADENLAFILEQLREVKMSGAIGNYLTIDPELEEEALRILNLKVRPAATQITLRDNIARFLAEIAVIGSCLEKMAVDLRHWSKTSTLEIQEPRSKKQKGSSAMPHKKNPIILERLTGQSRLLRANALVAMENIATWEERDISQSSPERIILPDATGLVVYMLRQMNWVISHLVVFRERMALNIDRTNGCWASEEVKTLLADTGINPEDVYRLVQTAAFRAMEEDTSFMQSVLQASIPGSGQVVAEVVSAEKIRGCFNFQSRLHEVLPRVYQRFNLDPDRALPDNC